MCAWGKVVVVVYRNPVRFFLSQESSGEVLASTKGRLKRKLCILYLISGKQPLKSRILSSEDSLCEG